MAIHFTVVFFPVGLLSLVIFLNRIHAESDTDSLSFHHDYSPPPPPPPPPRPPSVLSCEEDLGGVGSLDATCQIVSDFNFSKSMYVEGKGDFVISPNVRVSCEVLDCELAVNVSGDFRVGEFSGVYVGSFEVVADNVYFGEGCVVNSSGRGGEAPEETSGRPVGVEGAGGGYGGRGAACVMGEEEVQEDVWGGDGYGWSDLEKPWFYGSRGGSTSEEVDYGGGGGGRIKVLVTKVLEVNGSLLADGGDGGTRGGGGSGGSVYIKAFKMYGSFTLLVFDSYIMS